jgi:hypothetical protein
LWARLGEDELDGDPLVVEERPLLFGFGGHGGGERGQRGQRGSDQEPLTTLGLAHSFVAMRS